MNREWNIISPCIGPHPCLSHPPYALVEVITQSIHGESLAPSGKKY